jgi:hypothetical protein
MMQRINYPVYVSKRSERTHLFSGSRRLLLRGSAALGLAALATRGSGFALLSGGANRARAAEATATGAAPAPSAPAPATAPAIIGGFRHARFGMTESEVEQAVRTDFPTAGRRLTVAANPSERTTVLSLPVTDLLPGSGPAWIFYALGYRTRRLIQINILWQSEGDSRERDQTIVATANNLRDYFLGEDFAGGSVMSNRKLSDGSILVFEGIDRDRHMVLLLLNRAIAAASAAKRPRSPPLRLELSYIADSAHPDIYRIAKGQF